MKWPRWLPHLLTEPVPGLVEAWRAPRTPTTGPAERLGIRDVGECEVCGRPMQARTRREKYRGRVDCDCGHRNHVEFRDVRTPNGIQKRHVTLSAGRRFEAATHKPDLRVAWRYGICPSCSMAVRLLDACVVEQGEVEATVETIAYYCPSCHLGDDMHRGNLMGHDGDHIVDTLRFQLPHFVR